MQMVSSQPEREDTKWKGKNYFQILRREIKIFARRQKGAIQIAV